MSLPDADRRSVMAMLAALPLAHVEAEPSASRTEGAKRAAGTLVVYLSRSGNTRVIAGIIQRALKADLFEIHPARPYPDDYFDTVEQVKHEQERQDEPPLAAKAASLAAYRTVYLGFPIWDETLPPVIRTFLSQHDLSGKTVIPFITHGGYGPGNSQAELAKRAPRAQLQPAFVLEADQERRTTTQVQDWLKHIGNS